MMSLLGWKQPFQANKSWWKLSVAKNKLGSCPHSCVFKSVVGSFTGSAEHVDWNYIHTSVFVSFFKTCPNSRVFLWKPTQLYSTFPEGPIKPFPQFQDLNVLKKIFNEIVWTTQRQHLARRFLSECWSKC